MSVRAKMTTLAGDEGPPAAPAAWLGRGAGDTNTLRIAVAPAAPLRLTVWPVNTWERDVPAESVSVSAAVYVPAL